MNRLLRALKTDVKVQVRTNLYTIGVGAGILVAIVLGWLATPEYIPRVMPALMLIVTGGSILLYVAGLIIFEKEQGTLNANIVSPLRTSEYLWSKITSLTALATLESVVMIGGAMLIMGFSEGTGELPNLPLLLLGIIAIGVMYTLVGYTAVVLVGLTVWAQSAFYTHVVSKVGS